MRILLVLTGGTISTTIQNHVMGIHGNSPYLIVEKYREMQKEEADVPEFDIIEPVRMLSECNRPEYLEQIYYGILEKLGLGKDFLAVRERGSKVLPTAGQLPYNGIIITHGSDTLSYSAAFFSIVCSWLEIPLVLTAADYPLSDPRSNGMKNFSDSVDFIRHKAIPNVFVVWQNKISGPGLYLASELLEADTYRDCFSSYTGKAFGEIKNGKCTIYQKNTGNELMTETEGKIHCFYRKILDLHMKYDVLFLRPYPGLRYDLISLENTNVKAVVHYLYHSATACIEGIRKSDEEEKGLAGAEYNLLVFARYCRQLGIDLYLAGFKSKDQRLYETNDLLLKSGLGKPLYHVSPEMAYMKVLIAYNQTVMPVDEFLTGSDCDK